MEALEKTELTNDVTSLAALNWYNHNYVGYNGKEMRLEAVTEDFELLLAYTEAYNNRHKTDKPSLGDALRLPDGQTVYSCYVHDDYAQTCGGGSFCLSKSGSLSYSGGLDSGISITDMKLTTEKYVLPIWFSHRGYLCGGSAINALIECRVWEPIADADLSGIPQIERLRRIKLKEQSEIIIKKNGNGTTYMEHLPEIMIKKDRVPDELIKQIAEVTGLIFEDSYHFVPVWWCQPMTLEQIDSLGEFKMFKIREDRDFLTYQPQLIFEMKE